MIIYFPLQNVEMKVILKIMNTVKSGKSGMQFYYYVIDNSIIKIMASKDEVTDLKQ